MEIESVNAKANAGLTTGIIGTAGVGLGLLGQLFNGGGLGGLGNSVVNGLCSGIPDMVSQAITRQEYEHNNADIKLIAEKDAQIAELKMNSLMDSKVLDLYKYVEGKFHDTDAKFAEQGVWNATATGGMSTMAAQIANLQNCCNSITKIVIPNTSVCPGWGNVTITPAAATTTAN